MNRLATIGALLLLLGGCDRAPAPSNDTAASEDIAASGQPAEVQAVTFYLAAMNERLKIL